MTRKTPNRSVTLGLVFLLAGALPAQQANPQPPATDERARQSASKTDDAAAQRGKAVYAPACGFCHGLDARGAAGPDLARSLVIVNDIAGEELGPFLKSGRPDLGMPAFETLSPEQARDIAAFLHAVIEDSRKRKSMDVNAIVVGDPVEGAAFFNGDGNCRSCHNPNTDFKGIGSKYDPYVLQGRIINPRGGRGGRPIQPSSVRVTLESGQVVSGRLVEVSDFFVTLIDASGLRRTFTRDNDVPKLEISDPYQAHMDNFLKMTDKHMHDLTAYLVTLK